MLLQLHCVLITLTTTSHNEQELIGTEGRGPLKGQPFASVGAGAQGGCGVSPCGCLCVLVVVSWDTPTPRPWRTSAGGWKPKRDYRFAVWVLKQELLSRF